MAVFNMAGCPIEERRRWPVITASHEDNIPNKFRILKGRHIQMRKYTGIELTTSRLHNFIMAKVSHALNHSAMEAELTTSRLHSFIMAEVSHALNHSAMEAELTTSRLHSFIMAEVSHALNHSAMEAELTTSRLHNFIMAKVSHALNHSAMEAVRKRKTWNSRSVGMGQRMATGYASFYLRTRMEETTSGVSIPRQRRN